MANVALSLRSEIQQELASTINPAYEVFAAEVAMGMPLCDAAASAGFSEVYGQDLLKRDDVKQRVQEILAARALEGTPPKAWIEAQMVMQYRRVSSGVPDDALARQVTTSVGVLMNLAKLKGHIIDKSSKLSAKIDLTKLPRAQVAKMIGSALGELSPDAQRRIQAIQAGLADHDAETIDAVPQADGE